MTKEILILDFGSQYTQLIARKIRELNYYAEIKPFGIDLKDIKRKAPAGIILSGGPRSTYGNNAPKLDRNVFKYILKEKIPILGICYGMQVLVSVLGGKVKASSHREFGPADLYIRNNKTDLLYKMKAKTSVWMSHGDKVVELPPSFMILGSTNASEYAMIASEKQKIYGVQFHPEVYHTKEGKKLLKNFCQRIVGLKENWTMKNYAKESIREIKEKVGKERVLLGVSGGVDSMVAGKLLHHAIGKQLTCVYVDNGLARTNDMQEVKTIFSKHFNIPLHIVKAKNVFLKELKGVTHSEKKRKIIGKIFIEQFKKKALKLGHHKFFAQGTLYPDVIESVPVKGDSNTIKSHHNRVKEVMKMIKTGKMIEPLKELFKDEVRKLGKELKMPNSILYRHPFPGPGLGIRIIGEINSKRLSILRAADVILIDELKKKNYYYKVWQAFALFLPVLSVGVMGEKRTYENVIGLRIVESSDAMTADFARLPMSFLGKISNRIINEVQGVNRVVYDISSKPPATIEWE